MSEGFEYISARRVLSENRFEELTRFVEAFKGIKAALDRGWVAGGFVRMVLLDRCRFIDYFIKDEHWHAGDIDFFFPSHRVAKEAMSSFTGAAGKGQNFLQRSHGGFAKEAVCSVEDGQQQMGVKVQFICEEKMCLPTIEECLSDFDFLNCRVGLRMFEGDLQFVIARGWREAEDAGLLHVMNNKSPFLGKRIIKYLNRRDLTGLSQGSADIITGWLINVAQGGFPEFKEIHTGNLHDVVKELRSDKIVRDDHLILFINKWNETVEVSGGYGRTYLKDMGDWALNEIDRVHGGTGVKINEEDEDEW